MMIGNDNVLVSSSNNREKICIQMWNIKNIFKIAFNSFAINKTIQFNIIPLLVAKRSLECSPLIDQEPLGIFLKVATSHDEMSCGVWHQYQHTRH